MAWSFVYLALCRLVQSVVLLCRSERSKELEILLLRHGWRSCAGSRGAPGSGPSIGRSLLRSRGRYGGGGAALAWLIDWAAATWGPIGLADAEGWRPDRLEYDLK